MQNNISLIGDVGYEVTLQNFLNQYQNIDNENLVVVDIHTDGGNPFEAIAIYNKIKAEQKNGVKFKTIASGMTASAGTIIFLSGNKELREVHDNSSFLIHEASWGVSGKASDLQDGADELRRINNIISIIYERETDLDKDAINNIMSEDKMLNVDFLIENGFASKKIVFEAVAKYKNNNKNNMNKEELSKEELSGIGKLVNFLGFGKEVKNETKKEFVKNVIIKTASQEDLDFYEVEEGDPVAGDKATIDGEAVSGAIVLADGRTMNFTDAGALETVVEAEEEEAETAAEEEMQMAMDALKAENESLKEQLTNTVAKTELEAKQTELETLQNTHTELVNKLESFTSNETVDTTTVVAKKEVTNKKKTLTEKMQEMASKK